MAVELKKLVDSRIDSSASLSALHDVMKGGSNIVGQEFTAISSSTSNIDFTIQTPGLGVFMSRRVNIDVTIPLKIRIANTSGAPQTYTWGETMGPSAFPFNSLITSATVQINTTNFNTQVQQILPLIKRLYQKDDVRRTLSEVPTGLTHTAICYPFNAASTASTGSAYPQLATCSAPSPSQVSGNPASYPFEIRGVWNVTTAANVAAASGSTAQWTSTSVTIPNATTYDVYANLSVYEPLLIQPFTTDEQEPAFINTNLITVRTNLSVPSAALARIIKFAYLAENTHITGLDFSTSVPATAPFTQTSVGDAFRAAKLRCQFITPPATDQVPTKCIYPTTYYNPLATNVSQAIAASATDSSFRQSSVITLNTAPDLLAIYAVPNLVGQSNDGSTFNTNADAVPGASMEDVLLSIERVQIQWNNNPSLLVTLDKKDLWRRSSQNGLPLNWDIFDGTGSDIRRWLRGTGAAGTVGVYDPPTARALIGSPLLLALNKDIPVEPGVGAGVAGVYTLVVSVQLKNQLPFNITGFTLFVVPIQSQYLVLNSGATSDLINTVATEQVVASTPVAGDVQSKEMVGSGSHMPHSFASARRLHKLGNLVEQVRGQLSGMAAPYLGVKRQARDLA